jgi:hypothetical protein
MPEPMHGWPQWVYRMSRENVKPDKMCTVQIGFDIGTDREKL